MNKVIYVIVLLILLCDGVAGTALDTVYIKHQHANQIITSSCFHRNGNYFKTYASSSREWNPITVANFRLSPNETHWVYFVLKNESATDRTLKLFLNNIQAGVTKMYVVCNGKIDSSTITGSTVAINQRASRDRMLSFPFTIKAGETNEIYLNSYRKDIGITLTLTLNDTSLGSPSTKYDYLLIIVLTVIFFIALIALIVLVYFPAKENLWYLIYVLFGFLYVLAASGFGSLYVWSEAGWFEENSSVFFGAISTAAFFEFSRNIINIKVNYRVINVLLIVFSITYFLFGLLGFEVVLNLFPKGSLTSILQLPYLFLLVCYVLVFFLSIYEAVYRNRKELWWFAATFSCSISMSIFIILLELGIVKYNYEMHALLLAFGAIPQMTLTLFFLIKTTLDLLKERERAFVDLQLKQEQSLLNERLRISRELHDDMGSTLSSISVYSEVAKNRAIKNENETEVLLKIGNASRELIEKMSDIVWSLNPNNENFEQLNNRMMAFAAMMLTPKGILFEFEIDEEVKSATIAPEQRKNIFLIYKEAINNIVKYSEAKEVKVKVKARPNVDSYGQVKENKLSLEVIDNGKGFDTENVVAYNGNGLKNMKARAEEIKALFHITSRVNEGTGIELSFNI